MNTPEEIADRIASLWEREVALLDGPTDHDLVVLKRLTAEAIAHHDREPVPLPKDALITQLEIAKVNLQPGDRLVINFRQYLSAQALENIAGVFKSIGWPGEPPLIFAEPEGVDLAVISSQASRPLLENDIRTTPEQVQAAPSDSDLDDVRAVTGLTTLDEDGTTGIVACHGCRKMFRVATSIPDGPGVWKSGAVTRRNEIDAANVARAQRLIGFVAKLIETTKDQDLKRAAEDAFGDPRKDPT